MLSGFTFWMWLAGLIFLLMGLFAIRREFAAARGLEKLIVLGRIFAATSLALFGAEHLAGLQFIKQGMPAWIPWHLFWAIFVGLALIAAALSLTWGRYMRLSSTLLAVMIFLFVLMLHIPRVVANPHDRFAWVVALRDTAFASGFLAFAGSQSENKRGSNPLVFIGRVGMAIPFLFFAVVYILHPQNVPGVPLEKLTPAWMPWPHVLATITALFLLVAGVAILINRYARTATAWLGLWMTLLVLGLYLPILAQAHQTQQIAEALNYVGDTLFFAGIILLLAAAMPAKSHTSSVTSAPAS